MDHRSFVGNDLIFDKAICYLFVFSDEALIGFSFVLADFYKF